MTDQALRSRHDTKQQDSSVNFSQVKIKYEFSKSFPCDSGYVQQKWSFMTYSQDPSVKNIKFWEKSMIKIFPIEENAFLK